MTDRTESFPVDEGARLEVSVKSGDISLLEGQPGNIEIRLDGSEKSLADYRVEKIGNTVVVQSMRGGFRFRGVDVTVVAPRGTSVELRGASGDINVEVPVAELVASVAAGDVRVRSVSGDAHLKSAAGDIAIDSVGGRLQVSTAAGDLRVGSVDGELSAMTASGDVMVDLAKADATIKTASGDVHLRNFGGSDLNGKTMSGTWRVGIPGGRTLEVDLQSLSGSLRNDLEVTGAEPSGTASLKIKTLSGDVILTNA